MWQRSDDRYRGHRNTAENPTYNTNKGYSSPDINARMYAIGRNMPQQDAKQDNLIETTSRNIPPLPIPQNNPSIPPFNGMMFPGVGTPHPSSQSLFAEPHIMPPGYMNNRPPMNVPPPGFNSIAGIPLPGYNDNRIPGILPPPEYINNMVGLAPPDNRLLGSMPPPDNRQPGIHGNINPQHLLIPQLPPPIINNPGTPLQSYAPNQINVVNQQDLSHGNSSMSLEIETRTIDQTWVTNFIQERKLTPEEETTNPKVGGAKKMLQKWFQLVNEIEAQRDKLTERIKSGESEWQRELQKTNFLKEELYQTESEFSSQYDMDCLLKEIKKKKKKREWQKRQKKNLALKKVKLEKTKFELHLQIDQWREKEIAKNRAKFKAASMKKEAGGVLGDVRRKQGDSSKALSLAQALRKLRNFRRQEAELKGVYPKPTTEQNREFDERLSFLEKLMQKHHELYESEEKALIVMMAEEEEEKEKERRKKKHTKQLAEAAASDSSDPMREFYRYFTQAENGLDSLLHIRHGWDVYIVPATLPGASCIPEGNVSPVIPSLKSWAAFLNDNG